jgi:hypothetical protein
MKEGKSSLKLVRLNPEKFICFKVNNKDDE